MTYYGASDLAAAFRQVRKNTIQIAEDIPEAKYSYAAAPDTRTVAQMLIHIANSPRFQTLVHVDGRTSFEGLDFPKLFAEMSAEEQKPRSKAEIVAQLKNDGESFGRWLEGLTDEFLAEHFTMRPGTGPASKTRFEMLLGAKEHEMHHRGQLMLIERLLGITPHLTRQMQERFAAARS
jgi:uncharacterized damage-inducible protein DinB